MLLAGDVGGTKTRLALYDMTTSNGMIKLSRGPLETFDSKSASSLEELVARFLSAHNASVAAACIGIPGPVSRGTVKTTNLPWSLLNEQQLVRALKIPLVKLVNDLTATVASIPALREEDLITLHAGNPDRDRNVFAIVAPGTGLGQGYLYVDDSGAIHPLASEGGHVEFAPRDDLEIELLNYLRAKLKKRVSVERVLCGPGLVNIYLFLKDTGYAPEPTALSERLQREDPAAVISKSGISGEFELCAKALEIFCSLLGSHAGDTVLTYLSTGGLYLGGGIPPKIISKIQEGGLVQSYLRKGRLSHCVEMTPLSVIRDDTAALLGAASIAARARN